jgi:UDP-2,3-diacylglucosamine pyrophosphatase LpxH
MRTLILSDLHLGNGGDYDIFGGAEALPALLDRFVDPPTRVILNGDSMDFLMNEEPLTLEVKRAVQQAEAIATAQPTAPTLEALGRICKSGGEVLVRMGNHDVELALKEVRDVIRNSLKQPDAVAQRLTFERGSEPRMMTVGGAKILVTHGEQNDPFNQVDYENLPGPGAQGSPQAKDFEYPAGSLLVKKILNPLKRKRNMRFADLLKPDFQGAVLTALAVDPIAMKVALKSESFEIIQRALQNLGVVAFDPGADELGMIYRLQGAGLTPEEIEALQQQLSGEPGAVSYGILSDVFSSLYLKLSKAGLKLYARAQRRLADDSGAEYFSYKPGQEEWKEAKRLSKNSGAQAVILGHSHAARFKQKPNLLYANTGTWIWLMRLPAENASDEVWMEFLQDLKDDPKLKTPKNQAKLEMRFTPVTVEEKAGGGATITLHLWELTGELRVVNSAVVGP